MILYFFRTVQAKSLSWLSLYHLQNDKKTYQLRRGYLINKINSFFRPIERSIFRLNLNLFGKDLIPDFFSTSSQVRSLTNYYTISQLIYSPHHAFISNYSKRIIINSNAMVLPAHHFRCHIAWCSRSVLGVVWSPDACDPEICNP